MGRQFVTKAYTNVPDKVSGDVFSETMWDVSIRDNINNLISPAMCSVFQSQAIAALSDPTFTTINYATELLDTDAMHDNVTNNSRITANTAGLYVASSLATWPLGPGYRIIRFFQNGATVTQTSFEHGGVVPGIAHGQMLSELWDASATHFREIQVQSNSNALTVSSWFHAVWVGKKT
jgi:hypothetical protein